MPKTTPEEKEARANAIKEAKEEINSLKTENEYIELAPFVLEELNKFSTRRYQMQVETAQLIDSNKDKPLTDILSILNQRLQSLPKASSKEDKAIRTDLKSQIAITKHAIRLQAKHYGEEITPPDEDIVEKAQELPSSTIAGAIQRKLAVQKAIKAKSVFKHTMKPYTDAQKLIIQCSAYQQMDDIMARYNDTKKALQ